MKFSVKDTDVGTRLDIALCKRFKEISRSQFQKIISKGVVLVNGTPAKASYALEDQDVIELELPEIKKPIPLPKEIHFEVVYDDEYLAIVNKPAGLTVHPGNGTSDDTLVNGLLHRFGNLSSVGGPERPGIVHRLDKDTSGLLLVAKNDKVHELLSEQLAKREIHRGYVAIALRPFTEEQGMIEEPLGRHPSNPIKRMVIAEEDGGKYALTHWRVLEHFGPFNLIECKLETGRTHQIRIHLTHIKHPVLGDEIYGGGQSLVQELISPNDDYLKNTMRSVTRQMLHARSLKFVHPITAKELYFTATPPEDFMKILTVLREHLA